MKKPQDHPTRRPHRSLTVTPRNPAAGTPKRRWWLWGCVICTLCLAGYLATWSAGDWQMATASIRGWFRAAPPPEDDPEEQESPTLNAATPPGPAPEGMAWVPGGLFWRGSEEFPDAVPLRKIYVDGFWMDKTEVTNKQWREFATATGYKTIAERQPKLSDFPKLRPEALGFQPNYIAIWGGAPDHGFPGALSWGGLFHTWPALAPFSLVFVPPDFPLQHLHDHTAWWQAVQGADWQHPRGPLSSIKEMDNYPAVHICWHDAVAYCEWMSKKTGKKCRLPFEAEWEFAARGGLDRKLFCWGEDLTPGKKWQCNIWQGNFPVKNQREDGHEGAAPVASFPANGYGLHDLAGNVWEWCSDWYAPEYYKDSPKMNPKGPASSFDPREVNAPKRVQRGGSFLCCENYCVRFLPGARGKGEPTSAQNHCGFRCVMDAR